MDCCSDWPGKGRRPGGAISVPIGAAWAAWPGRANSVTEGSSAPSGTAANVGSDGPAVPGKSRAGLLKFGSERACAPPALSATHTHLGRLRRVVLPVKRDRSPGNPNSPGDYSSCVPDSVGACPSAMHKGLPRRSWACPVAQRGVLNGEGASATTAPKCTKPHRTKVHSRRFSGEW